MNFIGNFSIFPRKRASSIACAQKKGKKRQILPQAAEIVLRMISQKNNTCNAGQENLKTTFIVHVLQCGGGEHA